MRLREGRENRGRDESRDGVEGIASRRLTRLKQERGGNVDLPSPVFHVETKSSHNVQSPIIRYCLLDSAQPGNRGESSHDRVCGLPLLFVFEAWELTFFGRNV